MNDARGTVNRLAGENIPHLLSTDLEQAAKDLGMPQDQLLDRLGQARDKLFRAREQRIRPQLDDKVLTDWNGLMIAALACGGTILKREEYTRAASRAADFLLERMLTPESDLLHRYKGGEAGISGFLDDYAFLAWGLLNLAEATDNQHYLDQASALTQQMLKRFKDKERGGLFLTADNTKPLIIRPREIFDGAIPSGNSAALTNITRLIQAGKNSGLEQEMQELIQAFSGIIHKHPSGFTSFLGGLGRALHLM